MHIDLPLSGAASSATRPLRPGLKAKRPAAFASALVMLACSALPSFAQSYVTQYTPALGPVGTALDSVGGTTFLYVADEAHGNIIKINVATGATVATFGTGSQGTQPGQFGRPYGIAIEPTTHDLYVTERLNGRVQRINSTTGASVYSWGTNDATFNSTGQNTNSPSPTSPQGHFQEPIGVATDAAGNVYVVDHGNNRVQKFLVHQVGGAWTADNVAMWGTTGSSQGQFDHPYGAALDSSGNLWVADGLNGRVQEFNSGGTYLGTVGAKGTGNGQFVIATWVSFDPSGALYVTSTNSDPQNASAADINSQWVSKFTMAGNTGTFVSRFGGTYGSGPGDFKLPFSAVVDASNKAYVSDYYNSRVQVFDLTKAPAPGGTGGSTAPTVTGFTVASNTTTTVNFAVTFSGAVTGVDATDFVVTPSAGATASITSVTGTGTSYTVAVAYSGSGTVQLALKSSGTGITDASGNAFANGGTTSATFTIPSAGGTGGGTATAPSVSTFTIGSSTATSVTYQLTFNEAVTGVDVSDFTVATTGSATAAVGAVTGSNSTYSVTVSYTGTGTVRLDLKTSGTGIVDAAGNALNAGATGPTFTIGTSGGGGSAGVSVTSATVPANGTYGPGDALVFTVHFSGGIKIFAASGTGEGDDDHEDDSAPGAASITWSANAAAGQAADSGQATLVGPIGSSDLTFKYQVHGNDSAPAGIKLGATINLPPGVTITDAAGQALSAAQLTIPWPQNPLPGVILVGANESKGGHDGGDNHGAGSSDSGATSGSSSSKHGKGEAARLVNLSSRVHVKHGDASHAVVVGFVVSGTGSEPVLIRAVGPGLRVFGVTDALTQTSLSVQNGNGQVVASNSKWSDDAEAGQVAQRVGAFSLADGSNDSAAVLSLTPGTYTAMIGGDKADGEALIEVYDAATSGSASTEKLINMSTRGYVDPDGDLIIGFVVQGSSPKQMLIRAIGPGLAPFGVSSVLSDPVLQIHDSAGAVVAQNNDWGTPQPIDANHPAASAADVAAVTHSSGAFPLAAGSKDAAADVTLSPGSYTAVVTGAAHAGGAVLVEVYEVPSP